MGLTEDEKLILKQKRMEKKFNENHRTIQGQTYKMCATCGDFHPSNEDYFYKHKKEADGFYFECKSCFKKDKVALNLA